MTSSPLIFSPHLKSSTFLYSITIMKSITSVTQKGQVTLPKKTREKIGIHPLSQVRIEAARDHIRIYPVNDIIDLAGKYTASQGKNALDARAVLEEEYALEPET